jgi:hypothetical protein
MAMTRASVSSRSRCCSCCSTCSFMFSSLQWSISSKQSSTAFSRTRLCCRARMRYTQNTQKEVLMDCKPVAGFDYLARQGKFLKSKKAGYARMLQACQPIVQAALHAGVVMQGEHPVHGLKATPHNPPIPIHRSGGDSVLQRVLLARRNEGRDKQCLRVPKSSWYQSNTTKRLQ